MNYKIIEMQKNYKKHNIYKEFEEISDLNGINNLFNYCCIDKNNEIIIFCLYKKNKYCILIDSQLEDAYIFFIKNFINQKNINISITFRLLIIAQKIKMDENKLFEVFNLLNWPRGIKGLDYLNFLKKFHPKLQEIVLSNKISLKESILFHNTFKQNYEDFLDLISEKFSYSQVNKFIRNITEYSIKKRKTIDNLIDYFKHKNIDDFLTSAFILRYPNYSVCKNKFNAFINNLNLPEGTQIKYDKNFEKEEYEIQVNFKNIKSLSKKINHIKNQLDKFNEKNAEDLFNHKNLFKNEGKDNIDK